MPGFARSAWEDDPLAETLRGPSPDEARESLTYWRARLVTLPRTRRRQRREARAMIVRWEERLRRAELERWGGGLLGHCVAGVAVWRSNTVAGLARKSLRFVPRWLILGTIAIVLAFTLTFALAVGVVISALS